MTMITEPGIYEIDAETYHADPCPVFSLSRGVAHLLVTRSAMHAYHAHPRLGGGVDPDVSRVMDAGSAVHTMLLGKGDAVVTLRGTYGAKHEFAGRPFEDFKTKAAQDERDALREAGHIPVLMGELPDLRRAATGVTRQLHAHQDGADFFGPGRSEVMVAWREGPIWCRALIDRLPDDVRAPPYDLKMTKLSAAPGGWDRRLRDVYAFQDAFYRRGLAAVEGVMRPAMRFIVGELDPPHGAAIMAAAPSLGMIADSQVERAIRIWSRCVAEDLWPGYPPFTAHVEAKPWQVDEMGAQELRDEMTEDAA